MVELLASVIQELEELQHGLCRQHEQIVERLRDRHEQLIGQEAGPLAVRPCSFRPALGVGPPSTQEEQHEVTPRDRSTSISTEWYDGSHYHTVLGTLDLPLREQEAPRQAGAEAEAPQGPADEQALKGLVYPSGKEAASFASDDEEKRFVAAADEPVGEPAGVLAKAKVWTTSDVEEEVEHAQHPERASSYAITVSSRLSAALRTSQTPFGLPHVQRAMPGWDHALDSFCGVVICLNLIMMAVQMEYNSFHLKGGLKNVEGFEGSRPATEVWPGAEATFNTLEWVFGSFFILELVVRVFGRIRLKADWVWNAVDLLIIVAWVIERINTFPIDVNFDPTILRMARLVRLMRLVKMLRHLHMFDALHLIVKSIQSSMSVLLWTVAMLMLLMMVVAMVNNSLLEGFITDTSQDGAARAEVYRFWGSFIRAYTSMFEITLANWGPQCWLLMNLVDERWGFFFIVWRCCFGFAVIQVITSVFIQHTFKVANRDAEVMIQDKKKASEVYLKHLDTLFSKLDTSGDGNISWEEFEAALKQPKVRHWFGALEIDVSDLPKLFTMLDDGDEQISKEEFIFGLKRIKGSAQSIDLLLLMREVNRLSKALGGQGAAKPPRELPDLSSAADCQ